MDPLFPSVEQLVGSTIRNYRIEQLLIRSNVNAVYLARSSDLQQAVLITAFIVPEEFSPQTRERFVARFVQECTSLIRLRHQHIISMLDFGEHLGYPYLIVSLVIANTLAQLLKQHSRLTPANTLELLQQIAAGLDYAHRHGVTHGVLKNANILLDSQQKVQITGFGLTRILAMHDIIAMKQPFAHLFGIANTFLGASEYIAPEVVQGMPADARSDIYSLGIMLFEMLSGRLPFSGPNSLATAQLHTWQALPSLQALCPDLPFALDQVIQLACQRDPLQRYQSAGQLADAFADALQTRALLEQPALTGHSVPQEPLSTHSSQPATQATPAEELDSPEEGSIDPFVWWSTASLAAIKTSAPGSFAVSSPQQGAFIQQSQPLPPISTQQTVDKRRRRTVALLATGGAIAVAALGFGGINLARVMQKQYTQQASLQVTTSTQKLAPARPTASLAQKPEPTPTPEPSPTPTPEPSPTPKAEPTPTPKPSPSPAHTGTVIASTNMALNSSKTFTNPGDSKKSILVRLPNGNFVAYEIACPHDYVDVYYDKGSQKLVCAKHDAHFDPANGARVLDGPPPRPLPTVQIRVNGDGTITTG
jgi:serine/threonine-protein kinase